MEEGIHFGNCSVVQDAIISLEVVAVFDLRHHGAAVLITPTKIAKVNAALVSIYVDGSCWVEGPNSMKDGLRCFLVFICQVEETIRAIITSLKCQCSREGMAQNEEIYDEHFRLFNEGVLRFYKLRFWREVASIFDGFGVCVWTNQI